MTTTTTTTSPTTIALRAVVAALNAGDGAATNAALAEYRAAVTEYRAAIRRSAATISDPDLRATELARLDAMEASDPDPLMTA